MQLQQSTLTMTASTTITTTAKMNNFISANTSSNMTEEEIQDYLSQLQDQEFIMYIPALVFLVILAVTGLCGNTLVLLVYRTNFKRTSTRIFIMTIAAFDLVANVFCIPGEIFDKFHQWDHHSAGLCRAARYLKAFTTIASACLLLAVAISRYRKICHPFKKQLTSRHAKIISICLAIFGGVSAIPNGIINGIYTRPTPHPEIFGRQCSINDYYVDTIWPMINDAYFFLGFLSLCIPLLILYLLVGIKVYRHSKTQRIPMFSLKGSATTAAVANTHSMTEDNIDKSSDGLATYRKKDDIAEISHETASNNSCYALTSKKTNETKQTGNEKKEHVIRTEYEDLTKTSQHSNSLEFVDSTPKTTMTDVGSVASLFEAEKDTENRGDVRQKNTKTDTRCKNKEQAVKKPGPRSITNRTTFILILISLVFVASFIPHFCLVFFEATQPDNFQAMGPASLKAHHLFLRSFFLNSAVNPIVYSLCDYRFRQGSISVLRCWKK